MTLVTVYTPIQLSYTHDNYQTLYLGPQENTINASFNSFIFPGGTLYARALGADSYYKLHYYELRHDQIVSTNGLVLSLDGYSTRTNPQFILAPLEIFGFSDDANISFSYPLIRSRQKNLYLQGQFDYMNNSSTSLGFPLYFDPIRDLTVTFNYNDVRWGGDDSITLSLDKGFNIFGASTHEFHSRFGATPNFFKMNLTGARNQPIGKDGKVSVYILATGQYANTVLFASEAMTYGGPYLGRGYDLAQFVGDDGVAGKVELRLNTTPNLSIPKLPVLKETTLFQQAQFYIFLDSGKVWSLIPNNDLITPMSGTSTGVGVRTAIIPHVNAEFFLARPLTTPNATQVILGNSGKQFLSYFQITAYM